MSLKRRCIWRRMVNDMGYAIKCTECGEVIVSVHRHDYVTCKCGKTFVDGGTAYLRCGGEFEKDEDGCPMCYNGSKTTNSQQDKW
jgi:hypothetical protein